MAPKRLRRDPGRRKESIIDAATKLIVSDGPHAVTHRKIAAEAGVSLGSTTAYFDSLKDLLDQAFLRLAHELDQRIDAMIQEMRRSPHPETVLARELVGSLEDPIQARSEMIFALESIDNPQMREVANAWFEATEEVMRDFTTPAAARAIAIFCDGVMMQVTRAGNSPSEDELVAVFRSIMAGA